MTETPNAPRTETPKTHNETPHRTGLLRSVIWWLVVGVVGLWLVAALMLVAARWIDPPTTAVQMQRRMQAWAHHTPYRKRYEFIPLSQISSDLQHAVVAAEDARFYQHHGFDWHEVQIAAQEDLEGERTRGASTITQQLVKNLFFGTGRSILRKGAERWCQWRYWCSANSAFWRSTLMWSNGARVFMVQRWRAVTTTKPQRGISAGSRRHGWPQFCRLR